MLEDVFFEIGGHRLLALKFVRFGRFFCLGNRELPIIPATIS